ncbi:MAG: hypothetical protein MUC83_13175, partial [Pirellula sp.]|nr:hypothetical protein [Pirellula sp.]
MIRDWLESYRDSLVYWVCFSDGDVRHVQSLFGDEVYKDKVRICKSSRPDLMLYELYQRLVLSMPPGGMTYEFSHVVPPRRQRDFDFEEDRVRGALQCGRELGNPTEASRVLLGDSAAAIDVLRLTRDAISLRLKQVIVNAVKRESNFHLVDDPEINPERTLDPFVRCSLWKSPISRLTLDRVNSPIIIDAAGGVVRASAMAFDELTGAGYRVFWIETQDYMDADGLLRDLIRSLALRFGSFQSRQVTLHPRPCPIAESLDPQNSEMFESARRDIGDFLKDILREYRVNTARLAVLIYGRDGYGGCSGLLESNWKENGMDFLALHCVIGALATAGIKVLYFPLGKARSEVKTRKIKDWKVQLSRTNQLTETNTPFPRFLDSKKNWDSFNTKHSKESGRWQFDPLVDRTSFLAIDQTQGLLTPMINKIVATFYSFDSNMPTTLRPRFDRLRNYRKLTFFYALTLFRHSRLPNSLCSEASFACPFRFNDLGIDNDFLRSKESASWIAELRDARVFFDKPGGSIWMHRDVRLSLQQILEQTPIGEFAENFDESKLPRNYHFGELRSRLHFWIGDWYFKAFCSSGHLAPVVEALHHRLMAAKYAPIARQKLRRSIKGDSLASIWQYRLNLFESALLECSKTILISWHWLMLWQSSSFDASWVTKEHRESVIDSLTECMKSIVMGLNEVANSSKSKSKIKNTSLEGETSTEKRLSQAIQQFGHLLESLAEHLTVEGGGNKKLTCPYIEPRSAALCAVGDSAFAEKSPSAQKGVEHGLDFIRKPKAFFNRDLKSCFDSIVDDSNSATLVGVFSTILSVGESKMQIHRDANVAKMALAKANWKQGGFAVDKLHRMIWLLSETAYVFLRRAKLSYHATGRIDFSSWIISSAACNLGIDLCKHLPPSLVDFEVDAKIKLHEIYSIALANLGRFYESNRHLNIAQALLSKSRGQQKSDYGVLSMRRAESRLTECFWIRWFIELNEDGKWNDQVLTSDSFELTFGVSRFWFADSLGTSSWSEQLLKSRMKTELESDAARMLWVPPRISECFHKSINDAKKTGDLNANHFKNSKPHLRRLYSATLDEAVALLDQAERQLSGHSQSTLWWSRLHTLRLRIYGALSALGSDYTSMTASLCMRKYAPDTGIYNNFVNAYRIARHDDFRKLRTIKYFIEADDWYRTYVNGQEHVDRHKQNPSQSCLPEATGMAHQAYASLCTSLVSRAIDNPNGDSAKAIRLFCEAGTSFDTLELPRECINAASQHDLFASAVAR